MSNSIADAEAYRHDYDYTTGTDFYNHSLDVEAGGEAGDDQHGGTVTGQYTSAASVGGTVPTSGDATGASASNGFYAATSSRAHWGNYLPNSISYNGEDFGLATTDTFSDGTNSSASSTSHFEYGASAATASGHSSGTAATARFNAEDKNRDGLAFDYDIVASGSSYNGDASASSILDSTGLHSSSSLHATYSSANANGPLYGQTVVAGGTYNVGTAQTTGGFGYDPRPTSSGTYSSSSSIVPGNSSWPNAQATYSVNAVDASAGASSSLADPSQHTTLTTSAHTQTPGSSVTSPSSIAQTLTSSSTLYGRLVTQFNNYVSLAGGASGDTHAAALDPDQSNSTNAGASVITAPNSSSAGASRTVLSPSGGGVLDATIGSLNNGAGGVATSSGFVQSTRGSLSHSAADAGVDTSSTTTSSGTFSSRADIGLGQTGDEVATLSSITGSSGATAHFGASANNATLLTSTVSQAEIITPSAYGANGSSGSSAWQSKVHQSDGSFSGSATASATNSTSTAAIARIGVDAPTRFVTDSISYVIGAVGYGGGFNMSNLSLTAKGAAGTNIAFTVALGVDANGDGAIDSGGPFVTFSAGVLVASDRSISTTGNITPTSFNASTGVLTLSEFDVSFASDADIDAPMGANVIAQFAVGGTAQTSTVAAYGADTANIAVSMTSYATT